MTNADRAEHAVLIRYSASNPSQAAGLIRDAIDRMEGVDAIHGHTLKIHSVEAVPVGRDCEEAAELLSRFVGVNE